LALTIFKHSKQLCDYFYFVKTITWPTVCTVIWEYCLASIYMCRQRNRQTHTHTHIYTHTCRNTLSGTPNKCSTNVWLTFWDSKWIWQTSIWNFFSLLYFFVDLFLKCLHASTICMYFTPLLSAIRDLTLSSPIVAFNTLYNKLKLIKGTHLDSDCITIFEARISLLIPIEQEITILNRTVNDPLQFPLIYQLWIRNISLNFSWKLY